MSYRLLTMALTILLAGSLASASYQTDFSTDKSADFNTAQFGSYGSSSIGSHNILDYTGGDLAIGARYNQCVSQVLATTGEQSGDVWGVYGDTDLSMTYQYMSGSTVEMTIVGLGARATKGADGSVNSYPCYMARVMGDGSGTGTATFEIVAADGYRSYTTLDSVTLSTLAGGTAEYTLNFSVTGTGTETLTASLYENGSLAGSLSTTSTIANDTGWCGLMAGQSGSNSTYMGADVTAFSVNIPEPATLALLATGGLALLRRRKR